MTPTQVTWLIRWWSSRFLSKKTLAPEPRKRSEKTCHKEKAPVKMRKFRRNPRLGAAQRLMEELEDFDAIETQGELVGELLAGTEYSSDDSDLSSPDSGGDSELEKNMAEFGKYCREKLPSRREAYLKGFKEAVQDLEENKEKYLAEMDSARALKALKFYNQKHSTNYEVKETLGSYSAGYNDGQWTHCNFRAENTGGPGRGRHPTSRVFFAELWGDVDWCKVDSCVTLDGPGGCRDIVHGCEICPKWVHHPVNGFKRGRPGEYTY